jgi:methylenetetrahydrofolate dehydrogenase (NADP+)/methenyltetrahydrofolate cyclohydrolase
MSADIIDGKSIAADLRGKIAREAARIASAHKVVPGIAVVLVGEDPASSVYVRTKSKAVAEAGMRAIDRKLPVTTGEAELLALIAELNADPQVNGILVQMPLPKHMDSNKVLELIDPLKDVDGFHPTNVGRLSIGERALAPCTPVGSIILAKSVKHDLSGLDAVVVGRSNIVGKPMAQLLLGESCTVTIAHSRTRDLPALCRTADILVAAVGRAEMIRGDWIRPGATVIDVGINRVPSRDPMKAAQGKTRVVGDVAFDEAAAVAGRITPVPGGVGPMTIACLLANTYTAACRAAGVTPDSLDA